MDNFIEKICDDIFKTQDFNHFNNKTILITGANGLLGGIISDFFSYLNENKNFKINLLLTSKSESSKLTRIKHLLDKEYVKYFSLDMTQPSPFSNLLEYKIDYCFYSSGYATPTRFLNNPIETLNTNINGLYETLKFVTSNNLNSKFLYMSSGEIYSANDNSDLYKETDIINVDINNKRNFYKVGKIAGELLINSFRDKGFKASSIRTTICYGPGVSEDDNRVLSDLIRKGIKNDSIQLMDSGQSTRKLLHITDFCSMIFNIIKTCSSEAYNVNGKDELSIIEMAQIISKSLNKPVIPGNEINLITKYSANSVSMSITRYEEEFGKHNFKPAAEGITELVEWYKTILIN
jgi:dTDP-glucose 4,6-dehydratase/UDP-glucuronate decarboxylase